MPSCASDSTVSTRRPATAAASVRQESRGVVVDQHRAGAAFAAVAAGLGAGEADDLAQIVEQQQIVRHRVDAGRPLRVNSRRRAMCGSNSNIRPCIQFGQPQTLVNPCENARSPRPGWACPGCGRSSLSRAAQTRVSRPSTASSPPTERRWVTSKLERRNSLDLRRDLDLSPNLTGTRKRARASTSGMPMMS